MPLSAGSRLGPYEIVAPLGAGGMGEVFRARDTRLDRSVAIKILPDGYASNPQFKQRFEREARSISQLNHPHICVLHDVGEENGTAFLVMELLEGESLADRLARGPLPVSEAIRYGAQIAEALDCAHRAGIVHRDLKPGNVMLVRNGAKLLDFGLAKPGAESSASVLTSLATEQKPLTQEGTIVGTFQYMAPEQLEGVEADNRTDIFALGTVLYEMLTGRRAFDGKTRTSLIAAIVASDPPPLALVQPLTPPALEHVVRKCLSKDPDERWQSAHDVAAELRWIGEAGSQAGVSAPVTAKRKHREKIGWWLNLATALAAVLLTLAWAKWRTPPVRVTETTIDLPPDRNLGGRQLDLALSPDGSSIAFIGSDRSGTAAVYVRRLDSSEARPLSGTEGATSIFWSPDNRQLGFFADGKLKTVDVDQGSPQILCDVQSPRGASWGTSNKIVYSSAINGPLMWVSAEGGTPAPATKLAPGEYGHVLPSFLPDGVHVIYTAIGGNSAIFVAELGTGKAKRIMSSNTAAIFVAPNFLLFDRGDGLFVQELDPKSLELKGTASQLEQHVAFHGRWPMVSGSSSGLLAFVRGSALNTTQLAWVDRQGKDLGTVGSPALYYSPKLSHDGRRLAVDVSSTLSGFGDIWLFDLLHGGSTRLTFNPANESGPVWSFDDREIFFFSQREGVGTDLYRIASGGTGTEQTLIKDNTSKYSVEVSRDGQWLIYVENEAKGNGFDIWTRSFRTNQSKPWLATPFNEAAPALSPDGHWIAYQSDESGRNEIYVRAFPDSQEKFPVSQGGGKMPAWRADGHELNYISAEGKMMAVPIDTTHEFQAGKPEVLFETSVLDHGFLRQYEATDGTRFLLNRATIGDRQASITLVQNWPARIKRAH